LETQPLSTHDLISDRDFFDQAALFDRVAPDTIEHYLKECSLVHIRSGEVLLEPGADNRFLYVIVEGCLEVRLDSLERTPLTMLSRGECVGEMSVIERRSPSAYVVASVDAVVLAISHDVLWAMVGASHAVARNLLIIISGRLRSDNSIIADSAVIIRHFQKRSFTDALTGLHNRRWMEDFFTREIGRCQFSKQPAVLAVVDIDHFRAFNNSFGHLVGDHALGAVTEALNKYFRSDDLIARYGGDEFVILLPNTTLEEARVITERVRAAMRRAGENLLSTVPDCIGITVSIGIAAMDEFDGLDSLMTKADEALYRSKKQGRNRVSD